MPSLTAEERTLVAKLLDTGERVAAWVRAGTRVSAQTWVLTGRRVAMLDRGPHPTLAGHLPLEQITGVECAVQEDGVVLHCWSVDRRYDLVGADALAARRFEAAVRLRLGAVARRGAR